MNQQDRDLIDEEKAEIRKALESAQGRAVAERLEEIESLLEYIIAKLAT